MEFEEFIHFKNFVDNYNDPFIIHLFVHDTPHTGYNYLPCFNCSLFYHENDNDVLTKLKTINKYCDKFLVDTTNKEIHTNFYTSKRTISTFCNNFQFICDYQNIIHFSNKLSITDNKLINKNNFVTNNNNEKYIDLNITHIFDIETNQYLHTTVDATNNFIGNDMNYYKFITRTMINIKEEPEESHILNKLIEDYRKTIVNE
jgi:hypothetical protein